MPATRLGNRPLLVVLAGAVAIAFSGILYRVSEVSPSTGAFFRCLWALPPLWLLARLEDRRFGPRDRGARRLAWLAGGFFAADLVLWHHAIEQVGAGLATVLGNTQVVLVALLAWLLLGERPQTSSLTAIPVVGAGVVLISGALEQGAYGENPPLGALFGVLTGIAYAGFLIALRQGSGDPEARRRAAVRRDTRVGARLRRDRARRRRPRPDALSRGHGVAPAARVQLAGLRLAADLRLAPAPPGGPDVRPAHLPARLRRPVRLGAARGVSVGAAAGRRGLHPGRPRRCVSGPPPRRHPGARTRRINVTAARSPEPPPAASTASCGPSSTRGTEHGPAARGAPTPRGGGEAAR